MVHKYNFKPFLPTKPAPLSPPIRKFWSHQQQNVDCIAGPRRRLFPPWNRGEKRESWVWNNQGGSERGNKKGLGRKSVRDDSKADEDKEWSQLKGLRWKVGLPISPGPKAIHPQKHILQIVLPNRDPTSPTLTGSEVWESLTPKLGWKGGPGRVRPRLPGRISSQLSKPEETFWGNSFSALLISFRGSGRLWSSWVSVGWADQPCLGL